MNVTIKDIALRANVSHTTVSRALNDSNRISEKTRNRIKAIAAEMNYVPNLSAKSLVNDSSYNIGLFFSSFITATSADFIHTVMKSISEKIKPPYNLIINSLDTMQDNFAITSANFKGVIFVSLFETDDAIIEDKFSQIPFVVLNRKINDKDIINLFCDETSGMREAVLYLIKNGHKDIGFMEGYDTSAANARRCKGFYSEMEKNGLPINKDWIFKGDFSVESGYIESQKFLKLEKKPTAFVCASDSMAFGFIKGLSEGGMKIPNDISLIGFDNGLLSQYSIPSLSSIGRPIEEMCYKAADMLMDTIDGKQVEDKQVAFASKLFIKNSVANLVKN